MTRLPLVLSVFLVAATACGTETPRGTARSPGTAVASPSATTSSAVDVRTGPVRGPAASCVEGYEPTAIARRGFAFDGTVVGIGAGTSNKPDKGALDTAAVSFTVNEWWRGSQGSTVTVDMMAPTSDRPSDSEAPPAYAVGTRLLVSGEARWGGAPMEDPIAWGCGFTRYYDVKTADDWRAAAG
jgi:hypothetical protein